MRSPSPYVVALADIDETLVAVVGGKGAHLGALARIAGVRVPPGFVVTTAAAPRLAHGAPGLGAQLAALSRCAPDDRDAIRALAAEVRRSIEAICIPDDVAAAITGALAALGEEAACAVRSSATAEDLPTASFAGQHDSYLDVRGPAAVLAHVRRCWASLYTERAVVYRARAGVAAARMAVVVQQMVAPDAAGVLMTADPVTSNRKVAVIEAALGLGEALVAGRVNADVVRVRGGAVVERAVTTPPHPALTDAQVVRLARLGREIEAHFGAPQDIEWCLVGDEFHIVQSRPITTLFPIPAAGDTENHVYVSVGHQQMMTDPLRPLGLSVFQLAAARPMPDAGGRLFVDVTRELASPASRAAVLATLGKSDPLIRDALETIVRRDDFIRVRPDPAPSEAPGRGAPAPIATDAAIVEALIAGSEASLATLKHEIAATAGPALIAFIRADLEARKQRLFEPRSMQVLGAAFEATGWLNDHLHAWLGEPNAADTLVQSVAGNVTAEMGLALLHVADVIRPHAAVVAALRRATDDAFLDELPALAGGDLARAAIDAFLERYGMRGAGEIDITRPRWSERPRMLVPLILGNVDAFEAGEGARRFDRGRQAATANAQALLARVRALPDGEAKAAETARMIERVRTFIGYREYPKYGLVRRLFVYKQALLAEAARLVQAGVLQTPEDIFDLTLDELHEVATTKTLDPALVRARQDAFRSYAALTPPRVLTSDGECIAGAYRREDVPAGALVGLAVSAGIVEGRARVILDMTAAELAAGDILVTTFTDPSWTPLFVALAGLVTEVGGVMTHGAVIAREYGLPAVVGVADATRRIRDGQRIRVHGAAGYVELLAEPRAGSEREEAARGARGLRRDRELVVAGGARDARDDGRQERGLVPALVPARRRRGPVRAGEQVGAVGLEHQALERDDGGGGDEVGAATLVADPARDADVQVEAEVALGRGARAGEAMDDAADEPRAVPGEDREHPLGRVALVQEDG